jgi:abortive infection bacteriophage resistance protein
MIYNKQPISVGSQIAQLEDRGLIVENEEAAAKVLSIVSYFRFANYLRPLEADKANHIFKRGKSFNDAVYLYYFDKELRNVVFSALQTVEIALRTSVIQNFSMKHGSFWFMDASLFKNALIHDDCITNIRAELSRTKEDFIKEHFAKYDSPSMPPAWKTLEVISFGTLGKLYSNFSDNAIKKVVARGFNVPQHIYLESWIASLAALRNCCAHHARVWNRVYPIKPRLPNAKRMRLPWINSSNIASNKLYAIVCCLIYWVNNILSNNTFKTDMINLLEKYPIVDPAAMGFPHGWEEEPLWLNH